MDIGMSTASCEDLKSNGIMGSPMLGIPKLSYRPYIRCFLMSPRNFCMDCCDQRGTLSQKRIALLLPDCLG